MIQYDTSAATSYLPPKLPSLHYLPEELGLNHDILHAWCRIHLQLLLAGPEQMLNGGKVLLTDVEVALKISPATSPISPLSGFSLIFYYSPCDLLEVLLIFLSHRVSLRMTAQRSANTYHRLRPDRPQALSIQLQHVSLNATKLCHLVCIVVKLLLGSCLFVPRPRGYSPVTSCCRTWSVRSLCHLTIAGCTTQPASCPTARNPTIVPHLQSSSIPKPFRTTATTATPDGDDYDDHPPRYRC